MMEKEKYYAEHDKDKQTYFVELETGYQAEVNYQADGNVLTLNRSYVPEALRGKGYAGIMMEAVLQEIERDGYKIIPTCSYIVYYLERHEEWQHLMQR
ncbi:GNAT family N-acetyltransferase [Photobacterium minamisatsumaniensis]|uniref:GNAT family N-acetyltransferase n=1 Tax=Photobacterium minamisatsumaniensis TaxID=2910233 RepID=UPI003D1028F2